MLRILLPLAVTSLLIATAQQGGEVRPVAEVDFSLYRGTWYEIARYPNRFQTACQGDVTATYTPREDGKIRVVNRCREQDGSIREAEGLAKPAGPPNSKLKVRFAPSFLSWLPFVWGDYWVIDLAPDYSYAVVGGPKRDYLWVLARTPDMDEEIYKQVAEGIVGQGYDPSRLVRTQHTQQ